MKKILFLMTMTFMCICADLIAEWKVMKYRHIRYLKAIYIVAFIALTSAFFSCQSRKEKRTNSTEKRWLTFENDYFSLMYPCSYYIDGDFTIGADNLQNTPADSTINPINEIDVVPYNLTKETPWLHIVLSRCKIHLPLRDFMQNSIAFKGMGEEKVLLCSDVDSVSLAGLPALAVTFGHLQAPGDTLVQRQYIVQLPDYKLYYINIECSSEIVRDPDKMAPIFKILDTLKFK